MSDSQAFELAADVLERETSLERIESRGTVRLALKEAGLEARSVTPAQMAVVVSNVLVSELEARGIDDAGRICSALREQLGSMKATEVADTPDAVFARLGGR